MSPSKSVTPSAERWSRAQLEGPARLATTSGTVEYGEYGEKSASAQILIEGIAPSPTLAAFGTGPDVSPVVELARKAGFRTLVVGFRGTRASSSRFPDADEVISTSPAAIRSVTTYDESTYAVVMTHNFVDDGILVGELLETSVPYIGIMGPTERFERLVSEIDSVQIDVDRIYAPIGLDLGGGSPYQIAHSIVAEVLAVAHDRTPRHLRSKNGPVHE